MKFYNDEALTESLEELDFGDSWFTEAKTVEAWLLNDSALIQMNIQISVGEGLDSVKVKGPNVLRAFEKAPVTFTWKPKLFKDLKLNGTLHVTAVEMTKELIQHTLENPPENLTHEEARDLFDLTLQPDERGGMRFYKDEALTEPLETTRFNDAEFPYEKLFQEELA